MRIDFDESLRTGIDEIDEQHQRLIGIYNELDEALWQGKAHRQMEAILAHLFKYTKTHFAAEERLLAETGYPDLAQHQYEHRVLTDRLRGFVHRHVRNGERVSSEVVDFVRKWVMSHIMECDMAYVAHVRTRADALGAGRTDSSSDPA